MTQPADSMNANPVHGAVLAQPHAAGGRSNAVALQFNDLVAGYNGTVVINGVSGSVEANQCLCVIGRNGVGKTTLIKTLFGSLKRLGGEIVIKEPGRVARPRVVTSYCPQERPVFDKLTVEENLTLMTGSRNLRTFEPYFTQFPVLADRLRQQAGTLSGGEKKILAFTRTLSEERPIVLLDEPSEGVQWENILKMAELVKAGKERGSAFVVVEQNLAFASLLADSYLVMDQGQVVLTGTRETVSRADIVQHLHI